MAAEMTLVSRIILAIVLLLVQPSYAHSSVVTLGSFSNQRQSTSDDPHIEGYSLILYREGKIVFGRFVGRQASKFLVPQFKSRH